MNFKKLALAASLALAATAASAVNTIDMGTVTAPKIYSGSVAYPSSSYGPGYSFEDHLTFNVASTIFGEGYLSASFKGLSNIQGMAVSLWKDLAVDVKIADISPSSTSFAKTFEGSGVFTPGDYYFKVTGTTGGSNGGSYNYEVTAAVPEPETYAMFLAGLGIIGAIAKRRRSA